FFIGLIVIFLVSLLIGQITTPKYTPFKKVFAKGLYYSVIGLIGFVIVIGIVALVNDISSRKGSQTEFAKMTREQKEVLRDSLRQTPPAPTDAELKALFVDYNFSGAIIPCYESVHKLDIASLKEIKAFEVTDTDLSDGLYEIETEAEMIVNQPVPIFHFKGTFNVQYDFYDGDSDINPGWKLDKIFISHCEVIDAPEKDKVIGNSDLYPDLNRDVN
ncbi:MAG TPA: hypothetical protein VJ894_00430, partial [Cryomorphaceae bacterium]|nr:hypothetical protein [Cryomorphaceae bacterium]